MKINLKKHPELKPANELLKIFPKAIIAGGVARDLINGKEFKDVDVFIAARSTVELAKISFDICILKKHFNNAECLVSTFDMVSSQAWLEPTKDGFEVKATDLFHHFNKKKILGFYANVSRGSDHISRIREKYPDYLPLSLVQPANPVPFDRPVDDGFDDIPFSL